MTQERRLVTILFADLVGSTALGELLDPEEVLEVVSTAQAALAQTVTRLEGHVAKYLGDGLMALFGAPVAREDDAERAVLAGLQMQEALDQVNRARPSHLPPLQLRVGITNGEVIAGAMAGGYDVLGDAANTAARLQGLADVGGVLVDEETMRLARRRIRFGERQLLRLKGKAEPVAAYPALALRERMEERWETRQRTPLVGRERELDLLLEAFERARSEGGQLLTLVAEAGVGKSRLVAEALERIEAGAEVEVVRARCLSYGRQISLWLITDLVRTLCSLGEQDERSLVLSRLDATVEQLLPDQEDGIRAAARDVLGEILGLPARPSPVAGASAQIRRQVLVRSLRLLFVALARRSPVVAVLEDLHWSDPASIEVVTELLHGVPELPMLVLATHRPEWSAPWMGWDWPVLLPLAPLEAHQATRLAGAVLGGQALSPELERYVSEHAAGNPFFVEELLRSLQEGGEVVAHDGVMQLVEGAAERLPATLTEVLLARLDRLDRQVREVAQVASVIGRSFPVPLLARVVGEEPAALDPPLSDLRRAEIAFPRDRTAPQTSIDVDYVFKHATVRDVAYHTLLVRRRQALHAMTARAIAQLYPGEEYVETIAYHYARTDEHQEAASWSERAGDRAARVYANEVALGHYEQAREHLVLAGAGRVDLARLDEKLGRVLRTLARYDQAQDVLERAAAAYEAGGDLEGVAHVTSQMGWVFADQNTAEEGIRRITRLLERFAGRDPSEGLADLYGALAHLLLTTGKYQEQVTAAEHASELARAVGDTRILAEAEIARGSALLRLGQVDQAARVLEAAIPIAEATGDLYSVTRALTHLTAWYHFGGQFQKSREGRERMLAVFVQIGDPARIAFGHAHLGVALFGLGDWEQARRHLEEALRMVRRLGPTWDSSYTLLHLGRLCLAEGNWEDARDYLEECIANAERSGDLQVLPDAHSLLAELETLSGHPEAAVARLQAGRMQEGLSGSFVLPRLAMAYLELGNQEQAGEMVERAVKQAMAQRFRLALVDALRVKGILLGRQAGALGAGWEEAERAFEDALALARSMPYPFGEARALMELGNMEARKGDLEMARRTLVEALAIFERLGAKRHVRRIEQALALQDVSRGVEESARSTDL